MPRSVRKTHSELEVMSVESPKTSQRKYQKSQTYWYGKQIESISWQHYLPTTLFSVDSSVLHKYVLYFFYWYLRCDVFGDSTDITSSSECVFLTDRGICTQLLFAYENRGIYCQITYFVSKFKWNGLWHSWWIEWSNVCLMQFSTWHEAILRCCIDEYTAIDYWTAVWPILFFHNNPVEMKSID
jgi:hypothetical protein